MTTTAESVANNVIELSCKIGARRPLWVQGSGGNVSGKLNDEEMVIKPSGYYLEDVLSQSDLVHLMRPIIRKGLGTIPIDSPEREEIYIQLIKKAQIGKNSRFPSMEAGFHATFSAKYVLHFHPVSSFLMAVEWLRDTQRFSNWLRATSPDLSIGFLPRSLPGCDLSYQSQICGDLNIVLLENHGVILSSDEPTILQTWQNLETLFLKEWMKLDLAASVERVAKNLQGLLKIDIERMPIYFPDAIVIQNLARRSGFHISGAEVASVLRGHSTRTSKSERKLTTVAEVFGISTLLSELNSELKTLPAQMINAINNMELEKARMEKV